jgi:hypothetical protein
MNDPQTEIVVSEIHNQARKGVVVRGERNAALLAKFLIRERSAWFEVTPLPDDEFSVVYQPENHRAVLEQSAGARLHHAAKSILTLMVSTWTNHGELGEPYSDRAAAEIAINELIDYVRDQGGTVTYDNREIGSPYGVVVRGPEGQEGGS